jgi:hypothetical protein
MWGIKKLLALFSRGFYVGCAVELAVLLMCLLSGCTTVNIPVATGKAYPQSPVVSKTTLTWTRPDAGTDTHLVELQQSQSNSPALPLNVSLTNGNLVVSWPILSNGLYTVSNSFSLAGPWQLAQSNDYRHCTATYTDTDASVTGFLLNTGTTNVFTSARVCRLNTTGLSTTVSVAAVNAHATSSWVSVVYKLPALQQFSTPATGKTDFAKVRLQ